MAPFRRPEDHSDARVDGLRPGTAVLTGGGREVVSLIRSRPRKSDSAENAVDLRGTHG